MVRVAVLPDVERQPHDVRLPVFGQGHEGLVVDDFTEPLQPRRAYASELHRLAIAAADVVADDL